MRHLAQTVAIVLAMRSRAWRQLGLPRSFFGPGLALVIFGAACPLPTVAAEPPEAGSQEAAGLEEVKVTAQKITQDIQAVPISITALSAQSLEIQGVHNLDDVLAEIPNVSYQYGLAGNGIPTGSQGLSSARGITTRGITGPNTTSFYINDTPVPISLNPELLDVGHVEFLKGPQGTLYGQASMGGTIKIVTEQPSFSSTTGVLNTDGNYVQGGGAGTQDSLIVNAPVSSDSGFRFGGYYGYEPGFLERTYNDPTAINGNEAKGPLTTVDNVGTQDQHGAYLTYLWKPQGSLNLSVEPLFIYQKINNNGQQTGDYTADNLIQRRVLNVPQAWSSTFYLGSLDVGLDTGIGHLTWATGYSYFDGYDQEDASDSTKFFAGLSHLVPAPSLSDAIYETFDQEFRLTSDIGSALKTTAGVYFNDTLSIYKQNHTAPGANAASGGALGTDVGVLADFDFRSYEGAVFASATYSLSPRWSITAGLRQSWLQQRNIEEASGFFVGTPPLFSDLGYRANKLTPRFLAQYQVSDDKMLYVSSAQGFRPGGPRFIPEICAGDAEKVGLPLGATQYQSDSLWNYELGSKTRWLEGRLTANAAVYDIEWKNIQQSITFPVCGVQTSINGAGARSRGAELELNVAPIRGLVLGFSGGYVDASITGVGPGSGTLYAGQPLNGVPKWTLAGNVTYEFETSNWGKPYLRADVNYVGESLSLNTSPIFGLERPSYTLGNIRIGTVLKSDYDVSVYMKNITNARPNLGDMVGEITSLPQRPEYVIGEARTTGVTIRITF
jgi:iron complex outermembrane recepter protein